MRSEISAEDMSDRLGKQSFLITQNEHLALPINRITKEILDGDSNTLLKSELSDAEIGAFTVAQSFTDIVGCPYHQLVLNNLLKSKMAHKRSRVKEILNLVNPGGSVKKKGFFSRLFGGGD